MRVAIVFILLLGLVGGCSKGPTGVASWDEVRALSDSFVLKGNSDAVLAHTEWAGVRPQVAGTIRAALRERRGVSEDLRLTGTKVMSFAEYEALKKEQDKDLPEKMRKALAASIKWNVTPEKVIEYTFASKDASKPSWDVRMCTGVFQKNGLWFFAVGYDE